MCYPYTPDYQPVIKTIMKRPTGLIINHLRQNFSRFTYTFSHVHFIIFT
jgi:hypothetical protein